MSLNLFLRAEVLNWSEDEVLNLLEVEEAVVALGDEIVMRKLRISLEHSSESPLVLLHYVIEHPQRLENKLLHSLCQDDLEAFAEHLNQILRCIGVQVP